MDLVSAWEVENANSGSTTPARAAGDDGPGTPTTTRAAGSSKVAPSLEQELQQMTTLVSGMGKNFGSYWGSFRRQSATAIKQSQAYASSAAKDFTPLLDKAKAELDKLGEQAKASAAAGQAASLADGSGSIVNPDAPSLEVPPPVQEEPEALGQDDSSEKSGAFTAAEKGKGPERDTSAGGSPPMTAAAFFGRLQSQLSTNPNFQSFQSQFATIQSDLKTRVATANANVNTHIDFSKIDLHEAKEKYEKAMAQGDKYFKTASKELGDLFEGALKIVPPGEENATKTASRGADRRRKEATIAAAGRKETLLHRIRSDPAVLLVDPAQPPSPRTGMNDRDAKDGGAHVDTREAFAKYLQAVEEQGGLDGEAWQAKTQAALDDEDSGSTVKQTLESIVPSKLSEEAFWTRYFFRIQQIEEDEARRREIFEGVNQQEDEDFSWDMEDDSSSIVDDEPLSKSEIDHTAAVTDSSEAIKTPRLGVPPAASGGDSDGPEDAWGMSPIGSGRSSPVGAADIRKNSDAPSDASQGPSTKPTSSARNSSEEGTNSSYDIVSATSANSTKTSPNLGGTQKKEADEDEDSDWE